MPDPALHTYTTPALLELRRQAMRAELTAIDERLEIEAILAHRAAAGDVEAEIREHAHG